MQVTEAGAPEFEWSDVRRIFLRWERLRIVYNAALVALVVLLVALLYEPEIEWALLGWRCVVGAVIANVCFFAGPMAETYLNWLGVRNRGVTAILFLMGMLFSLGLAAITVMSTMGSL
jgi:hypothetical protein